METLTTEQTIALQRLAREAEVLEAKSFKAGDLANEGRGRGRVEGLRLALTIVLGCDEAHAALLLDGDES